jgi:hypothetical protein
MLRPFLARASNVQVRHRFFTDESSLLRWCREICYLAEPVCLVIAAHGSSKGVALEGGRSAGAKALAETLRHASNLKLLHFSSCEVLKGRMAADIQAAVPRSVMFPVSGYTTTADWAASAMVDFLFLDLILTRGLSPEQAAGQVVKLMPFAGDKTVEGSALKPLGFRFVKPAR